MPSTTVYVKEVYYQRLQAIAKALGLTVGGVITEAVEWALSDEKEFVDSIAEELPEESEEEEVEEVPNRSSPYVPLSEEVEEVPEEEVEEAEEEDLEEPEEEEED